MNAPATASLAPAPVKSAINIPANLLERAKANDTAAIVTMFRQFAPEGEQIYFAEYLGVEGMLGLGGHSFGCLTDRRIATIRVQPFGEMLYQDGLLEYINSTVVHQPSKLLLYVLILFLLAAVPFTFGIALLLVPFAGKIFYRIKKSGLVFVIREGISVYVFTNRDLLTRANHLHKTCTDVREQRIKSLGVSYKGMAIS